MTPNKLIFGRELRGKFPEFKKWPKHSEDLKVRKRDRKRKEKMKKYVDKRRHTAVMTIKEGDTVLCRQERKNSLTPHYDHAPMVVIEVKRSMITAKKSQKIRSRNYAVWKFLKKGYRESVLCGKSDGEDAFEPDPVPPQEVNITD